MHKRLMNVFVSNNYQQQNADCKEENISETFIMPYLFSSCINPARTYRFSRYQVQYYCIALSVICLSVQLRKTVSREMLQSLMKQFNDTCVNQYGFVSKKNHCCIGTSFNGCGVQDLSVTEQKIEFSTEILPWVQTRSDLLI